MTPAGLLRALLRAVLIAGAVLIAVLCLREGCQRPQPSLERVEVYDTTRVTIYDTIRIVQPQPSEARQLPAMAMRLPLYRANVDSSVNLAANVDSLTAYVDSADVAVPMEQKVFTDDSTYRAVVSGAWVSLDTMEVFRRHETTTILHEITTPSKPKRWSLGVGVGYGMTPKGFSPWAGVSLSYSLWQW